MLRDDSWHGSAIHAALPSGNPGCLASLGNSYRSDNYIYASLLSQINNQIGEDGEFGQVPVAQSVHVQI
jgi:hypothetical protein